jgi:DNA topoisomerase VI subunit B
MAYEVKMTKTTQFSKDYNREWFSNGFDKQILYTIYLNNKIVKVYTSTQFDKEIYATLIFHNIAKDGIVIVPHQEELLEVKFHVNKNKKFSYGTKFITITAE